MKIVKIAFALAAISFAGAAQAAPPQCSKVCTTNASCKTRCFIGTEPGYTCEDYGVCHHAPKKVSRFEQRLEPAPSQPSVKEVLATTTKS